MALLARIVLPAIIAGILAGGFLTAIQHIEVIPLVLEAETYEAAGAADAGAGHGHDHDHDQAASGSEPWAPDNGMERTAYTLLANVLAAAGFGLLLSAAFVLYTATGRTIDWRRGLLWGLAGFGAFSLAPSLGLPPELPGSEAAALGARQGWWAMTAILTLVGFGVIAFAPRNYQRVLGVVPIVIPHLIGAPQPEHHGGLAPEALMERYVYASLATNLVFWLALGALSGYLHRRFTGPGRRQLSPA